MKQNKKRRVTSVIKKSDVRPIQQLNSKINELEWLDEKKQSEQKRKPKY